MSGWISVAFVMVERLPGFLAAICNIMGSKAEPGAMLLRPHLPCTRKESEPQLQWVMSQPRLPMAPSPAPSGLQPYPCWTIVLPLRSCEAVYLHVSALDCKALSDSCWCYASDGH